jgi:hypothetical protein
MKSPSFLFIRPKLLSHNLMIRFLQEILYKLVLISALKVIRSLR